MNDDDDDDDGGKGERVVDKGRKKQEGLVPLGRLDASYWKVEPTRQVQGGISNDEKRNALSGRR